MRRLALAAAALALAAPVAADEGITVVGAGEVRVKPDRLEFEFRTNGVAEIAGDASVKLRDAQARTEKAFGKLQIAGLKLEPAPIAAAYEATPQQHYYNGMPTQAPTPKLDLARQTKVVVTGIDKLADEDRLGLVAKLLDAARDAGAKFGNARAQPVYDGNMMRTPGFLRYTLTDHAAPREAASKKAFDDAKARAARLAELSGGTVGPALDIVEEPATVVGQPVPAGEADDGAELPVRVRLKVRFKLNPGK